MTRLWILLILQLETLTFRMSYTLRFSTIVQGPYFISPILLVTSCPLAHSTKLNDPTVRSCARYRRQAFSHQQSFGAHGIPIQTLRITKRHYSTLRLVCGVLWMQLRLFGLCFVLTPQINVGKLHWHNFLNTWPNMTRPMRFPARYCNASCSKQFAALLTDPFCWQ